MTLDVPDEVRRRVLADGHAAWLDGLPSVLDSLTQDWSLTMGATMRGGNAALVVEATLADGAPPVLKAWPTMRSTRWPSASLPGGPAPRRR
jgi:streptomycin 6-kinase